MNRNGKIKTFFRDRKGQGLLELIVAVGIISAGLFSVWNMFLSNFSGEKEAEMRIVGVNLAREGIEAVRNIRDSNWLKFEENLSCGNLNEVCQWDSGLSDGRGIVENILSDGEVSVNYNINSFDNDRSLLYFNGDEFYEQSANAPADIRLSPYRRLVAIRAICCPDSNPADLSCDDHNFTVEAGSCLSGEIKVGVNVVSEAHWQINGRARSAVAKSELFNWR